MSEPVNGNPEPTHIPVPPPPPPSEHNQQVGGAIEVEVLPDNRAVGLEQYPMTDAIGMAANVGAFRSEGVKVFLKALSQSREMDLKEAREEKKSAQTKVDEYREKYFDERTKNAVLTERIRGDVRMKKIQNVLITFGSIMFGAGLQPIIVSFSAPYFVMALIGFCLLLMGWFFPKESKDTQV